MRIRSIIREFVPPVLLKGARLLGKTYPTSEQDHSVKTYLSYEEALKNCTTKSGYEDNQIVQVVFEKTKAFFKALTDKQAIEINSADAFLLIPLLNFNKNRELRIIDLGGACGAHYFIYKKIAGITAPLKWYVVETPEMCKYGRALENEELQFRDNLAETIKESGKADLLLTSGTIQCVDDPYNFLVMIANSGADHILFNRLGLTLGQTDVITLHKSMLSANGIGKLPEGFVDIEVEYPFSFIRKDKFDFILEEKYSRKIEWTDQSGIFPVNDEPITGLGVLFQLNG